MAKFPFYKSLVALLRYGTMDGHVLDLHKIDKHKTLGVLSHRNNRNNFHAANTCILRTVKRVIIK